MKIFKTALLNALFLGIFLEFALNFTGKSGVTYNQYSDLAVSGHWEKSSTNGFTLKRKFQTKQPNQDRNLDNELPFVTVTTNAKGFRTTAPFLKACSFDNLKRVYLLGDSFTFGAYLSDVSTIASQLQLIFNNQNECIEVINAGYAGGYEIDQIHSWLVQNVGDLQANHIVYILYPGNDISGIDETAWQKVDSNGLPVIYNSTRYEVINGGVKDKLKPPPYYLYKLPVLRNSKLAVTLELYVKKVARKLRISNDLEWEKQFAHHFGVTSKSYEKKEDLTLKIIKSMSSISDANKAKFSVAYMPSNFEVYPVLGKKVLTNRLYDPTKPDLAYSKRICKRIVVETGISCLNLHTQFVNALAREKEITSNPLGNNFLFPSHGEIHISKSGARETAKLLYQLIKGKRLD